MAVDVLKQKDVLGRQQKVLSAVAEYIKQPLLCVRNQAEMSIAHDRPVDANQMFTSAQAGLFLAEHYITLQRLVENQTVPNLQQAGLAAVLHDVKQQLTGYAKQQQVQLELDVSGSHGPVITNEHILSSGLSALGLAFIEAHSNQENKKVVFGVHKSRWGIVAGVYASELTISNDDVRRYNNHLGFSRQLLPMTSHASMAGVAVADGLFSALMTKITPSKHNHMDGLAVLLQPSPQLTLL